MNQRGPILHPLLIYDGGRKEVIIMAHFNVSMRARSFVVTMQVQNMKNLGWKEEDYENPEWLAYEIISLWEDSGRDRTCAVSVCRSKDGLYHAHIAAYGNTTTLRNVAGIFGGSHTEPQLGGKKELSDYIQKLGKYAEKDEEVLYTANLDAIQDRQGQRSDLEEIDVLIQEGLTPSRIFAQNIHFWKYEKIVRSAYMEKRNRETPVHRNVNVVWHVGSSGSGKTYTFTKLVEQYGEDHVYFLNDYENGGFDKYEGQPVLFLDELKDGISYKWLLTVLDQYKGQIHCRYANVYMVWDEVHITSVYPPEEIFDLLTKDLNRDFDTFIQLKRRLTTVVFHYKSGENYFQYSIPADAYTDFYALKYRALGAKDGFIALGKDESVPFD